MPMYMDIHEVQGATAADVAKAHIADVKTQGKYGVEYHKYWLNESTGKISASAARRVRKRQHRYIVKHTAWSHPRSSRLRPRSRTDSWAGPK